MNSAIVETVLYFKRFDQDKTIRGNELEAIYRLRAKVFMPDYLDTSGPMEHVEFNLVTSKIRGKISGNAPEIYDDNLNPDGIESRIETEKVCAVDIVVSDNSIFGALTKARTVLEEKLAIITF